MKKISSWLWVPTIVVLVLFLILTSKGLKNLQLKSDVTDEPTLVDDAPMIDQQIACEAADLGPCPDGTIPQIDTNCFRLCPSPSLPVCGNNRIEGDEECDDGNTVDNDWCSSTCAKEPLLSGPAPGETGGQHPFDSEGNIYYGTERGIFRVQKGGGKIEKVVDPSEANVMGFYGAVYVDEQNRVVFQGRKDFWAKTFWLMSYDTVTKKIEMLTELPNSRSSGATPWGVLRDRYGRYILLQGKGLVIVNQNDKKVEIADLPGPGVIAEDEFIGLETIGKGLLYRIGFDNVQKAGLGINRKSFLGNIAGNINGLAVDLFGNFWVGGYGKDEGNALIKISNEGDRKEEIPVPNKPFSIVADGEGFVYFSGGMGKGGSSLYRVNPNTLTVDLYGCDATVPGLCESGRCGDGKIDFEGVGGSVETCEDGNKLSGDGCSSSCQKECGNSQLDEGEECDDGNRVYNDECSNACTAPRQDDSLLGYWRFDEKEGLMTKDSSKNGFDGKGWYSTQALNFEPGKFGNALRVNSGGNPVVIRKAEHEENFSLLTPKNALTISAWVKADVATGSVGERRIVWKVPQSGNEAGTYGMKISSTGWNSGGKFFPHYNVPVFFARNESGNGYTNYAYNNSAYSNPQEIIDLDDSWHLLVGTISIKPDQPDDQVSKYYLNRIYVDGVLKNQQDYFLQDGIPLWDNGADLFLGGFYYSGLLDDVKIYDRALMEEEIRLMVKEGEE